MTHVEYSPRASERLARMHMLERASAAAIAANESRFERATRCSAYAFLAACAIGAIFALVLL